MITLTVFNSAEIAQQGLVRCYTSLSTLTSQVSNYRSVAAEVSRTGGRGRLSLACGMS